MKKPFSVGKKGNVAVPVRAYRQRKGSHKYTYYLWDDYTSGERQQQSFSDPEIAKHRADEIAKALAKGETDLLALSAVKRPIQNALELVEPTGLRIDEAARLVAEALKVVPAGEVLDACKFWHNHRPTGIIPKKVGEFVYEFLQRQKGKISERRQKTNTSYLAALKKSFGDRCLHEITSIELADFADAKDWCKRTRNDALTLYSQFWKEAVARGYAVKNPASSEFIERDTIKGTEIGVFTPNATKQVLYAVENGLKAPMALWCFSGIRISEIARLSCVQVRQGLKSGSIFLGATETKTQESRSVEICGNLRQWLERYLPATGPVMPEQWQSISGLSELSRHVARWSGVTWKKNAPRHTFATMSLALHKDAPSLVKQMGTSLSKLEKHYWARAASITAEDAKEYFAIMPGDVANIVPLHTGSRQEVGKEQNIESATEYPSAGAM